ncbi:tail fiber assembly protein [Pantoea brenneri]|uniref:tail fiber assembly protein n=1 Tax=Pantoea brenneri TaxID=472694 RepID=UPI003C7C6E98
MSTDVYAIINSDGLVVDVQLWDGKTEWAPPEGMEAVLCEETGCGIGSTYKNGTFSPPPELEVTKEHLIAQAEQQKSSFLAEASQKISILQDAVDLDMATDDETSQLTAWKKYRVLLNRIDTSKAPDIKWPNKPS